MPVPGLENLSLFNMISDDDTDHSRLYELLCECAQKMLDKYHQKPVRTKKLEVKIGAVKALLGELVKMPEDLRTTRETILSALKSHVEALQGYEHLLSAKGNNYELMQQTQGLRKGHDDAPATLLRYHELKNKFLGSDTPLSGERKAVISELAENRILTLKMLEALEAKPVTIARILKDMHKAGLLVPEPDLCHRVIAHKYPNTAALLLISLKEMVWLEPHLSDLFNEVLKYKNPILAFFPLDTLKELGPIEPDWYFAVLKHKYPDDAALALVKLVEADLFEPDLCAGVLRQENPVEFVMGFESLKKEELLDLYLRAGVFENENSFFAIEALKILKTADLIESDLCIEVLKHKDPVMAAMALVELNKAGLLGHGLVLNHKKPDSAAKAFNELNQHKLYTADNFSEVLKHRDPYNAVLAITKLHSYQALTDVNQGQILKHQKPCLVATIFGHLGETLCKPGNIYAVINHSDISKLAFEIGHLKETGKLDQGSFEDCMVKTGYIATGLTHQSGQE